MDASRPQTPPADGGTVVARGGGHRLRSRLAAAVAVLLLLPLCAVTVTAVVWLERAPVSREVLVRDLECLSCHSDLLPALLDPRAHEAFAVKDCLVCHTRHGRRVEERTTPGADRRWRAFRTVLEWPPLRRALAVYDTAAGAIGGPARRPRFARVVRDEKLTTSTLTAPQGELCWMCHAQTAPEAALGHGHAPFAEGRCGACHDPHVSRHEALLKRTPRDLCATCHPLEADLARRDLHEPFAERDCLACHRPHASGRPALLPAPEGELCKGCHPRTAELEQKAVQHQPFRYDGCTRCHGAHSANESPLLVERPPALCYGCHPEVSKEFRRPSAHPVDGWQLECEDCHDPHAADNEQLVIVRDNELCFSCHPKVSRSTYQESAHALQLCVACHTPHGSAFAPVLRRAEPDLCLRCHPAYEGRNSHPVRPDYYDPVAERGLTCTSTCHRPHGTMYPRMLTHAYRWDGLCLQCHPGVGVDY